MNHHWRHDPTNRRQHWLRVVERNVGTTKGLVYEVNPNSFSVYGEGFQRNPFAREFLGVFPTLEEAKDLLVTVTASQHQNI